MADWARLEESTCQANPTPQIDPPVDPTDQFEPHEGDVIGGWLLVRRHARGGTADVWLACRNNETAAIKVPHWDDPKQRELIVGALLREADLYELVRQIKGISVPRLLDAISIGDLDVLVLEYLEGQTLSQLVFDQGPLPWKTVVEFGLTIAGTLAAMHAQGIFHGDVKPGNIIVTGRGPVVFDFGNGLGPNLPTVPGDWLHCCTVGYASSHILCGGQPRPIDDTWALAGVLFFALAGHQPFLALDPIEALELRERGPAPLERNDVPPELEALIANCLKPPTGAAAPAASDLETALRKLLPASAA